MQMTEKKRLRCVWDRTTRLPQRAVREINDELFTVPTVFLDLFNISAPFRRYRIVHEWRFVWLLWPKSTGVVCISFLSCTAFEPRKEMALWYRWFVIYCIFPFSTFASHDFLLIFSHPGRVFEWFILCHTHLFVALIDFFAFSLLAFIIY